MAHPSPPLSPFAAILCVIIEQPLHSSSKLGAFVRNDSCASQLRELFFRFENEFSI